MKIIDPCNVTYAIDTETGELLRDTMMEVKGEPVHLGYLAQKEPGQ